MAHTFPLLGRTPGEKIQLRILANTIYFSQQRKLIETVTHSRNETKVNNLSANIWRKNLETALVLKNCSTNFYPIRRRTFEKLFSVSRNYSFQISSDLSRFHGVDRALSVSQVKLDYV